MPGKVGAWARKEDELRRINLLRTWVNRTRLDGLGPPSAHSGHETPILLAHSLEQEIGLPVARLLVTIRSFDQLAQLVARLGPFYLLERFPEGLAGSAS